MSNFSPTGHVSHSLSPRVSAHWLVSSPCILQSWSGSVQNTKSVKCPRCGVYTVNSPALVESHVDPVDRRAGPVHAFYPAMAGGMSIVECGACFRCFVVDGQRPVWPLASPPAPDNVPVKVKEAYEDARLAHAAGANIGALMAARTALIRFQRDKQVNNFKGLVEKQIITPAIYGGVDQLRLWAAVAGHDDIEIDTFDPQEVEDILDYLATALEAAYTHQARVDEYVRRTNALKNQSADTQSNTPITQPRAESLSRMSLVVGGDIISDQPDAAAVDAAIRSLPDKGSDDDAFVILIDGPDTEDSQHYIQTCPSPGGDPYGFIIEYREGSANRHYQCLTVPPGPKGLEEVAMCFIDYLSGDNSWKTRFDWERQS